MKIFFVILTALFIQYLSCYSLISQNVPHLGCSKDEYGYYNSNYYCNCTDYCKEVFTRQQTYILIQFILWILYQFVPLTLFYRYLLPVSILTVILGLLCTQLYSLFYVSHSGMSVGDSHMYSVQFTKFIIFWCSMSIFFSIGKHFYFLGADKMKSSRSTNDK